MPVTAKLSKLFYDRLGEQIANELVEWFNLDALRFDVQEVTRMRQIEPILRPIKTSRSA